MHDRAKHEELAPDHTRRDVASDGFDETAIANANTAALALVDRELGHPVQRRAVTPAEARTSEDVHTHAQHGVSGGGERLPHLDRIQASFGPEHDLSDIRAHVGGDTATASAAMGAEAYATGRDVAFARRPDLFTAAHEAAHVVQQQQGVSLLGGVGHEGDAYERHADLVATQVVEGRSVVALLGGGGTAADSGVVQRKSLGPPDLVAAVGDAVSRSPEDTDAASEREYSGSGASRVGKNEYRLWGFAVDSAVPRESFVETLNELAVLLRDDEGASIVIVGHTSSSGPEAHNVGLSTQRAVAIANELKLRGAVRRTYTTVGVGEAQPLVTETAEASSSARNRRVEIQIIPGEKDEDAAPPKTTPELAPARRCHITVGDARLMRSLARAEAQLWATVQSKGLSTGKPVLGFDDAVVRPDKADWVIACGANSVPTAWRDYYYEQLSFPVDGNFLQKINALNDEANMYQALLDSGDCDPGSATPPPEVDVRITDGIPGARDAKGRYY